MVSYYNLQLRQNPSSMYSKQRMPREVSEYELGEGVLGQADTYTREIKILNTLKAEKRARVIQHEKKHLEDPSLPEELVRDLTNTWSLN